MTDTIESHSGLVDAMRKELQPETAGFRIVGNPAPLFEALAKAQATFKPIVRSKTVHVRSDKGSYDFQYAPLESVIDSTREALSANGLTLFQPLGHEGSELILSTILAHSSGAHLVTRMTLPQVKSGTSQGGQRWESPKSAQEIGSAITYMRRYMAQSVLGVNAEEDDDGAQGEQMPRELSQKPKEQPRTSPTPPKVEKPAQPAKQPPAKPVEQSAPPKKEEPKAPAEERALPIPGVEPPPATESTPLAEPNPATGLTASIPAEPPPSAPPPVADGEKAKKETITYARELVLELGMSKMVPEWCKGLLGVEPAKITTEAQWQVLIADLEKRKASRKVVTP
jgi:hypothetical protein